jgi:predicted Zn-dependent protease with MMP-like domain
MGEIEEEYDYQREIEPDKHTLNENMNRSRYFFAMISFLIALIILGIYFNNYYDVLSGWLLLAGAFAFGVIGVFFLLSNTVMIHSTSIQRDYQGNVVGNTFLEAEKEERLEVVKDSYRDELSPFEQLVREALATIPTEFHEQMENVLVRVQYEPGDEVMHRVGIKEGYTLLGLYEGVPLTAYGQARLPHPEIITIYERSIVEYCHGDPDRIRRQVRHTVLHEVAHHFGIDHEEMPIWIQ